MAIRQNKDCIDRSRIPVIPILPPLQGGGALADFHPALGQFGLGLTV